MTTRHHNEARSPSCLSPSGVLLILAALFAGSALPGAAT